MILDKKYLEQLMLLHVVLDISDEAELS